MIRNFGWSRGVACCSGLSFCFIQVSEAFSVQHVSVQHVMKALKQISWGNKTNTADDGASSPTRLAGLRSPAFFFMEMNSHLISVREDVWIISIHFSFSHGLVGSSDARTCFATVYTQNPCLRVLGGTRINCGKNPQRKSCTKLSLHFPSRSKKKLPRLSAIMPFRYCFVLLLFYEHIYARYLVIKKLRDTALPLKLEKLP